MWWGAGNLPHGLLGNISFPEPGARGLTGIGFTSNQGREVQGAYLQLPPETNFSVFFWAFFLLSLTCSSL